MRIVPPQHLVAALTNSLHSTHASTQRRTKPTSTACVLSRMVLPRLFGSQVSALPGTIGTVPMRSESGTESRTPNPNVNRREAERVRIERRVRSKWQATCPCVERGSGSRSDIDTLRTPGDFRCDCTARPPPTARNAAAWPCALGARCKIEHHLVTAASSRGLH